MGWVAPTALIGLVVLGIALRATLGATYGPRKRIADDPLYLVLAVASWTLIGVGLVGTLLATIGPCLIVLVLFFAAATAAMVFIQWRLLQRRMLGNVLAVAAEKQLPLETTLPILADQSSGRVGAAARSMGDMLAQGVPLIEAVEWNRGALPEYAPMFLRVGLQTGAVAPALRESVETSDRNSSFWLALSGRVLYLSVIVFYLVGIVSFMMISIVPSMVKIFDDFELELPAITLLVIDLSNVVVGYWYLAAPFYLLAVAVLLFSGLAYIGVVDRVPFLERFLVPRHAAPILRALALAVEGGRPVVPALDDLQQGCPVAFTRDRLDRTTADVERGHHWIEALRRARLIRKSDAAVLRSAERVGNLPWALRTVADAGLRRITHRVQALMQIIFPVGILAIGLVVALFVTGMFVPLVKLISALT